MAETSLLLLLLLVVVEGMRSTTYSHESLGRRSPNGTGGEGSSIVGSAVTVRGYREKVSSWLRAKMKSSSGFDDDDDGG